MEGLFKYNKITPLLLATNIVMSAKYFKNIKYLNIV